MRFRCFYLVIEPESSKMTYVGIGVGVGAGVLLLIAISICLCYYGRNQKYIFHNFHSTNLGYLFLEMPDIFRNSV